MSMDAGGLAQMTYNSSFNNGPSLGAPGSSFGSRRKGPNVKRLSVPPPHISTIDESQPVATPRTSRSHLLAGLRTAPKSATVPSANQRRQHLGLEGDRYGNLSNRTAERGIPQTATGTGFPRHPAMTNQGLDHRPMYTLPEQVLAPPALDFPSDLPMDDSLYAELMSTNLFLAAQQQRLQQQLLSVTAAAQQFQGLNLGVTLGQQQQDLASMSAPTMGFYQQQLQQGVQPVVQPIAGQPGLFSVYNPLTGQLNYIYDNSTQQDLSPPYQSEEEVQPPPLHVPPFRAEVSPPLESVKSPVHFPEDASTNSTPSSEDGIAPLPPPSANAFRRAHKKNTSFNPGPKSGIDTNKANNAAHITGPKTAPISTPATGTFGPGQGRAGEHPVRQPRGPPSLEELVAKPTSMHEGSKNFATRQRRRAVHNLVRAGIERRGETRSLGTSSGGTNTPASEKEFTFSDNDDATVRSAGSLSSKPSLGSLRAVANGAIGSERKERSSRERKSQDSPFNTTPLSEKDGYFAGKFADRPSSQNATPSVAAVVAGQKTVAQGTERRKTPMLVLSSAEKRKTPIM
ncbi:hypothetical protein BJX70DRAFT_291093 [Aspergillus crustosus]